MKRLWLKRKVDSSGVSGLGIVAEGVQFTDGTIVIRWLSDAPTTVMFDDLDTLKKIHGHHGNTKVIWRKQHVKRTKGEV